MAKALIKEVADMLSMRDWVALTHTWAEGQRGLNWAPFATQAEAEAMAKKVGGLGGTFRVVKLFSPGTLLADIQGKKDWNGYCHDCGHAPFTHSIATSARGKCLLNQCGCIRFQKEGGGQWGTPSPGPRAPAANAASTTNTTPRRLSVVLRPNATEPPTAAEPDAA